MDSILVTGNGPLNGQIPIAGAKNACLTLMPATLLSEEPLTLTNAPRLSDIKTMTLLLQSLGAEVSSLQDGQVLAMSSHDLTSHVADYDIVRKMRASNLVLGPMLARLSPAEVVAAEAAEEDAALREVVEEAGAVLTPVARSAFDSEGASKRLQDLYGVKTLDAFGAFTRAQIAALGAVLAYVEITQRGRLPMVKPPRAEAIGGAMRIDAATRRNLEITRAMSGGRDASLLAAVDRTVTAAGARLLETRLSAPSTDRAEIAARHDAVAALGRLDGDPSGCIALYKKGYDVLCYSGDLWVYQQALMAGMSEIRNACKPRRRRSKGKTS